MQRPRFRVQPKPSRSLGQQIIREGVQNLSLGYNCRKTSGQSDRSSSVVPSDDEHVHGPGDSIMSQVRILFLCCKWSHSEILVLTFDLFFH